MIQRCTNPNAAAWEHYGGRGIAVCERWRDFSCFLLDMGERPEGCSIDRINVNAGYYPDNCRWATKEQQARNTRVRRTNKTGCTGVCWVEGGAAVIAYFHKGDKRHTMYWGRDFFEAVCARKSWESRAQLSVAALG